MKDEKTTTTDETKPFLFHRVFRIEYDGGSSSNRWTVKIRNTSIRDFDTVYQVIKYLQVNDLDNAQELVEMMQKFNLSLVETSSFNP